MRNPYYNGPVSDHFDGTRFFNPDQPATDKSFSDILKWRRSAPDNPWPRHIDVQPVVPEARVDGLRITMVGHATVFIQVAGLNILTDPVFSNRASPFQFMGPMRVTPPGILLADLPPIDIILLSHNHYDHLDIATLRTICSKYAPLVVTPLGNDTIIQTSLPHARVKTGDWGDKITLSELAEVTIVPANHWSARGIRDKRMALWGGFMLRVAGKLIYFAGDTGYGTGRIFQKMHIEFGSPDIAILPIGAYDPRWFMAAQHVNPEEAVQIMCDVAARTALAIHWGTFKLTDEQRDDPLIRMAAALRARNIDPDRFKIPQPAEAIDFF